MKPSPDMMAQPEKTSSSFSGFPVNVSGAKLPAPRARDFFSMCLLSPVSTD